MNKMTQVDALEIAFKKDDSLIQSEKERLERLEKYSLKIKETLEDMNAQIQRGEFESFSEEDIRYYLSHLPDVIADVGLLTAKFQRSYDYAKLDTSTINAELWKVCNEEKDSLGLSSAKDRESWVKTQPQYIKAQRQELEWRYHLDRMKIIYDRYQNLFTSTRKLANLITDIKQVQDQYTKYVPGGE